MIAAETVCYEAGESLCGVIFNERDDGVVKTWKKLSVGVLELMGLGKGYVVMLRCSCGVGLTPGKQVHDSDTADNIGTRNT